MNQFDFCYTECGLPGVKLYAAEIGNIHMCRYTLDRLLDGIDEMGDENKELDDTKTLAQDALDALNSVPHRQLDGIDEMGDENEELDDTTKLVLDALDALNSVMPL